MDSIPAAAAALWAMWAAMRPVLPADVRWFVQRSGRAPDPLYSAKPLENARYAYSIIDGKPVVRERLSAASSDLLNQAIDL
jgi:hypothetical protein